ncbi:hypothetical protein [Candidatus Tokpelaia sp.]|uniref:hypothetical protein n=1 Tax=Candidatus Tokpelaia sp. TaxID=2233777 RepID=UPI00123A4C25|nr:hypothetical protein [Candidatus Tokpelaia sp.]KAA6405410.1 hypothetical protein DPQ22_04950 [Candidatus Tokpelaia sp.]
MPNPLQAPQDSVVESPAAIKQAETAYSPVADDTMWGCSEEELRRLQYDVDRHRQQDDYKREKDTKDHKARLEREKDSHHAWLSRMATGFGLLTACICFVLFMFLVAVDWFCPFLPQQASSLLLNFVTFGFGVIARDIIGNLFAKKS